MEDSEWRTFAALLRNTAKNIEEDVFEDQDEIKALGTIVWLSNGIENFVEKLLNGDAEGSS
jgi:phage FluMu gp28-like protein